MDIDKKNGSTGQICTVIRFYSRKEASLLKTILFWIRIN